jgi:PucR family transcriptional regulator, purine catabolism regulatory protein
VAVAEKTYGRPMAVRDAVLTLGDLLDQEPLALELLAGGDDVRARRVAGAHTVEIDRPTDWLAPDWIMLTTGVRLRGSAAAQRRLVEELADHGAAALGFGLDLVFKQVPPALLEAAQDRGFPVFGVPLRTPFREITSSISRALLSRDLRAYQRLSSMQLYLLDALGEPEPREAVARRLAGLLDASVLVLAPDGTVELAEGTAPAAELWAAISARPAALMEFAVDGWHAVAVPVLDHAPEPRHWLVVASAGGSLANPLTKPVTQAAAPLLAATDRLGEAARTNERAIRSAVLDEVLAPGLDAAEGRVLAARVASLGIDFAQPARVALVASRGGSGVAELRVELEARLLAAGLPHLATVRQGAVALLVQAGDAEVRAHLAAAVEERPGLIAGLGRPVASVADAGGSLRDAQLALERLVHEPADSALLAFEDFELGLLLLAEAPPERVRPKVEEWSAPLRAKPMLWEAVVAFLVHDQDVAAAARALHLHPNSLRYRLSRVERLLGRSLRRPSTIAGLYIALLASEAKEDHP